MFGAQSKQGYEENSERENQDTPYAEDCSNPRVPARVDRIKRSVLKLLSTLTRRERYSPAHWFGSLIGIAALNQLLGGRCRPDLWSITRAGPIVGSHSMSPTG